jgi:hypothetical protein
LPCRPLAECPSHAPDAARCAALAA